MTLQEIYGLPATATRKECNEAAAKHAIECSRGMHGSTGHAFRVPVPQDMEWDQAQSKWVEKST